MEKNNSSNWAREALLSKSPLRSYKKDFLLVKWKKYHLLEGTKTTIDSTDSWGKNTNLSCFLSWLFLFSLKGKYRFVAISSSANLNLSSLDFFLFLYLLPIIFSFISLIHFSNITRFRHSVQLTFPPYLIGRLFPRFVIGQMVCGADEQEKHRFLSAAYQWRLFIGSISVGSSRSSKKKFNWQKPMLTLHDMRSCTFFIHFFSASFQVSKEKKNQFIKRKLEVKSKCSDASKQDSKKKNQKKVTFLFMLVNLICTERHIFWGQINHLDAFRKSYLSSICGYTRQDRISNFYLFAKCNIRGIEFFLMK